MTQTPGTPEIEYTWRGPFDNVEVNRLHAAAFETREFSAEDWDWVALTSRHSLGWVVARAPAVHYRCPPVGRCRTGDVLMD